MEIHRARHVGASTVSFARQMLFLLMGSSGRESPLAETRDDQNISPRIGDDLICGASAIAEELGEPIRRIYYLLQHRKIPSFHLGGRWYARRSALREFFERLENDCHNGSAPSSGSSSVSEKASRRSR